MIKNLAVALTLTIAPAFARAQTSNHYEATDENEPSEEESPKAEPPSPAPRPVRATPRVFRVVRPGGTRVEPNAATEASEPDAAISGDGQSLGGQGMGIERVLAPKPAAGDRLPASGGGAAGSGTAPVRGCGAPAGFSCQIAPKTFLPPITQCGGPPAFSSICTRNIPFDIKWSQTSSLQYFFYAPANIVQVHPIMFSSAVGAPDAYIITQETSDQAGTHEAGRVVVLSAVPGSMDPVNSLSYSGSRCARSVRGLGAYISINFSNTPKPGECSLKKDVQYYLNVKAPTAGKPFEYLLRVDY